MPVKSSATIVVLCVLAFVVVCCPLVNATSPKEQYERGVELANSHRYAEAMKLLRKAADQGLPDAQEAIGELFHYGAGTARDDAEAIRWYRKAADQGDVRAQ